MEKEQARRTKTQESTLAMTIVGEKWKIVKEWSCREYPLQSTSSFVHLAGPGGQEVLKCTLAVRLKWKNFVSSIYQCEIENKAVP